jgi:predicted dinucleotide-binding enzyme
VLLAVPSEAVEDALEAAGGKDGVLAGKLLMDCTNAVRHGVGTHLLPPGESVAERSPPSHQGPTSSRLFISSPRRARQPPVAEKTDPVTVPMCGDETAALATTEALVRDLGEVPVVLGPLDRTRQLEDSAGFVIGLVFAGANPASAIPSVDPRKLATP